MAEVINNKEGVPISHYLRLYGALDPKKRAEELQIPYREGEEGGFRLTFLGSPYRVTWPEGDIFSEDPEAIGTKNGGAKIFLLRFLIEGKVLPATGQYKTFPELPWGAIYTKTFNGRCIARAAYKFGTNLEGFRAAASALRGTPLSHGDAGYSFCLLPGYELQLFVWEGDDEFPPNAQILYSDNFAAGFTAEDSVVAAETLISALAARLSRR